MTALFADTFYWIALADPNDSAHRVALTLTAERATSQIVTTDEVLTEYLTFFASAPAPTRREAAEIVEDLLTSSIVRVVPQSRSAMHGARTGGAYHKTTRARLFPVSVRFPLKFIATGKAPAFDAGRPRLA